jgi:MFS family permease
VAVCLRRFGFRTLVIGAATLTSLFYASYSLFTASTPHPLLFVVLMIGGLCNAMAMVTINTLGYREIPRDRIGHATTTSSMVQQLSLSIGVVLGASLLALTSLLRGEDGVHLTAPDFAPAFIVVGLMTLLSVASFRQLPANEGAEMRGNR